MARRFLVDRVQVPHVWDFEPGLQTFDGPVWYERRFHLPELEDGHASASSFWAPRTKPPSTSTMSGQVTTGGRTCRLRSTSPSWRSRAERTASPCVSAAGTGGKTERSLLPPGDHDWWLYGGLFRSVYLEAVPQLSIARILVGQRAGVMEERRCRAKRG